MIQQEEDTLAEAAADGAYAHTFTQARVPKYFDSNQRWAWDLGWRLQEFLELEKAEK